MPSLMAARYVQLFPDYSGLGALDALKVQVGGKPEPPKHKSREERHDDFYANVGDAIRTLREDVPTLFKRELNCALQKAADTAMMSRCFCSACHRSVPFPAWSAH
jgi:hypothetical protein